MKPSILTLILILLSPVSLAQPTLEQGYDAYESGEVSAAIRIWRALGEAGNATAQVNLGQLYRLGHNVVADDREAVKWYSLAARQGSEVAKYNLMLMHTQGRASRGDLDLAFAGPMSPEEDELAIAADSHTKSEQPDGARPGRPLPLPPEDTPFSGEDWFDQLPAPLYVIQVVSSPHKQVLTRYAAARLAHSTAQVLRTIRNGRDHYLLLLGPFATRQDAREAVARLPENVKADQPWVRPAFSVQQIAAPGSAADTAAQDWFRQLPPRQYVLQLASSPHEESLQRYSVKHLGTVAAQASIVHTTRNGRDHYLLLLGPFDTRQRARAMITELPQDIQEKQPYARSAYSVQRTKPRGG